MIWKPLTPLRWLKHHMPADAQFTLTNVTDDMGVLALTGKYSRDVMSKLSDTPLSHTNFPFLECRNIKMGGVDVQATRISYTGITCIAIKSRCFSIADFHFFSLFLPSSF